MIMVSKFIFNISNFSVKFGILFSTVVNAVFVAKLLISGIFFSNSVSFFVTFKEISHIRNFIF